MWDFFSGVGFLVVLFNSEGWVWGSFRFVSLFVCFLHGDRICLGLLKCLIIRYLIHHPHSLKDTPVELTSGGVRRCVEICSKPLPQMSLWLTSQSEENDEMSLAECVTAPGWTAMDKNSKKLDF